MEKEKLIKCLEDGLGQRAIAKKLNLSQATIRYWLEKYDLKNLKIIQCKYCFTKDKNKFNPRSLNVCSDCQNQKYIQRWIKMKKAAIDYLGGKCNICNYNKYYGALEFHHLDPKEKDGAWNEMKKWSWSKITKELDKCQLLCSNCHKETHAAVV